MGVAQNTLNENHFNFQMKYSQEHFKEALMARAKRGNPVGKLLHHKHANLLPAQGFSSSNASKYLLVILLKNHPFQHSSFKGIMFEDKNR